MLADGAGGWRRANLTEEFGESEIDDLDLHPILWALRAIAGVYERIGTNMQKKHTDNGVGCTQVRGTSPSPSGCSRA